jgi:hypothetical protein
MHLVDNHNGAGTSGQGLVESGLVPDSAPEDWPLTYLVGLRHLEVFDPQGIPVRLPRR